MNIKSILSFLLLMIWFAPCLAQKSKTSIKIIEQSDPYTEMGQMLVVNKNSIKSEAYGKRLALVNNNGYARLQFHQSEQIENWYEKYLGYVYYTKGESSTRLRLSYTGNRSRQYLETDQDSIIYQNGTYKVKIKEGSQRCRIRVRSQDSLTFELDYKIIEQPKLLISYQDTKGMSHKVICDEQSSPIFPAAICTRYPIRFRLLINGKEVATEKHLLSSPYSMGNTMREDTDGDTASSSDIKVLEGMRSNSNVTLYLKIVPQKYYVNVPPFKISNWPIED